MTIAVIHMICACQGEIYGIHCIVMKELKYRSQYKCLRSARRSKHITYENSKLFHSEMDMLFTIFVYILY